jgi:hypothetical protein
VESFDEAPYTTVKCPSEDFVVFCARLGHKFRKLKDNCGIDLPAVARGCILARQWGLTPQGMREMLVLHDGRKAGDRTSEVRVTSPPVRFQGSKTRSAYLVEDDDDARDTEINDALQALGITENWEIPDEVGERSGNHSAETSGCEGPRREQEAGARIWEPVFNFIIFADDRRGRSAQH